MKKIIYLAILTFFAVSCGQVKDIAYFQQATRDINLVESEKFDATIKPKDILSITVVSSEPTASSRYNLIMPQASFDLSSIYSQPTLQGYLVDNNGNIEFPTFGTLHVQGMSTDELEDHLTELLKPFFTEELPVINARIMNYSVNVIGEVARPGRFETLNGRITIFEGLAMAGDMTIYGRRDNVKVLREDPSGERVIYNLDLNSNDIFDSPAFYLQQNDVLYVEPNQSRANASRYGPAESYRTSVLSVLISLATLGVSIYALMR